MTMTPYTIRYGEPVKSTTTIPKFNLGDVLVVIDKTGMAAPVGSTATVRPHGWFCRNGQQLHTWLNGGDDVVLVEWDDDTIGQSNGAYFNRHFALTISENDVRSRLLRLIKERELQLWKKSMGWKEE